MKKILTKWLNRYFAEPEAIFLVIFIAAFLVILATMGRVLVPIITSIVLAYLLNGFVNRLLRYHFSYLPAVLVIYCAFLASLVVTLIWLIPIMLQQLVNLFNETPLILRNSHDMLMNLQLLHPDIFTEAQLKYIFTALSEYISRSGQYILSFSLASIGNIISIVVYLFLVPLLVFFFLKDKKQIMTWIKKFLPTNHLAVVSIWQEIDRKIGDYIRGKLLEIFIVTIVCEIAFLLLNVNYTTLLSVGVGLSAIIPYIGAVLVAIPALLIAYFQWGFTAHFFYFIITFVAIIAVDGNILVPLLFSEKMNLHPVAIILALLIFGSIWGFWGVFFAIPLATVANALLKRWPKKLEED